MLPSAPAASVPGTLVLHELSGSWAHGTNTSTSDEDWRGVFLLPNSAFLGLDRATQTCEAPPDQVFWELGHFCRLLLKGNPNLVGMLFAPDDCVALAHPVVAPLFDARAAFLHRDMVASYMGWVHRELRDIAKLHKGHPKRLSHVPRLLWEVQSAILHQMIDVRPPEDRRQAIVAIKTERMRYDDAVAFCGSLLLDTERVVEMSPTLPDPPRRWLLEYLLDAREAYGR